MQKEILLVALLAGLFSARAQVGFGTETPDPLADAELGSNNKALLLNRVKKPETAFGSEAVEGMLVFDDDAKCIKGYAGGAWVAVSACPAPAPPKKAAEKEKTEDNPQKTNRL